MDEQASAPGFLRRWSSRTLEAMGERLDPYLVYRVIRAIVREFRRTGCMQRSGELAFYVIVALIPFTALLMFLLVWVTHNVVGPDWTPEDVSAAVEGALKMLLPGEQRGMTQGIAATLIDDQAALGAFGLLLMLITSSFAFGAVNRALATIFKCEARGQLTSIFLFSALLSGIGIIIFIALSVIGAMATSGDETAMLSQSVVDLEWLVRLTADGILIIGFSYLLKSVVERSIRWAPILMGAVFFTGCFELMRVLYEIYLTTIAQLNVVYGSLAGTMATVLWFYYVAFMFLSSLCLVRVLDDRLYDAS